MWLELRDAWINTEHLVRVDFTTDEGRFKATLITVKPGGSDRSFLYDDDASKLKAVLEMSSQRHAAGLRSLDRG